MVAVKKRAAITREFTAHYQTPWEEKAAARYYILLLPRIIGSEASHTDGNESIIQTYGEDVWK